MEPAETIDWQGFQKKQFSFIKKNIKAIIERTIFFLKKLLQTGLKTRCHFPQTIKKCE